ncbi:hypothetical protein [Thermoplasma sp. Kam2015]|uniref:hypothetical protein n=1 Tax=Thermoplasma sp. Kam2015 TaxID=2094122 RepID=UPI001293748C|nr:hypothetical protein [Thermoplasma sp. Kam2015]
MGIRRWFSERDKKSGKVRRIPITDIPSRRTSVEVELFNREFDVGSPSYERITRNFNILMENNALENITDNMAELHKYFKIIQASWLQSLPITALTEAYNRLSHRTPNFMNNLLKYFQLKVPEALGLGWDSRDPPPLFNLRYGFLTDSGLFINKSISPLNPMDANNPQNTKLDVLPISSHIYVSMAETEEEDGGRMKDASPISKHAVLLYRPEGTSILVPIETLPMPDLVRVLKEELLAYDTVGEKKVPKILQNMNKLKWVYHDTFLKLASRGMPAYNDMILTLKNNSDAYRSVMSRVKDEQSKNIAFQEITEDTFKDMIDFDTNNNDRRRDGSYIPADRYMPIISGIGVNYFDLSDPLNPNVVVTTDTYGRTQKAALLIPPPDQAADDRELMSVLREYGYIAPGEKPDRDALNEFIAKLSMVSDLTGVPFSKAYSAIASGDPEDYKSALDNLSKAGVNVLGLANSLKRMGIDFPTTYEEFKNFADKFLYSTKYVNRARSSNNGARLPMTSAFAIKNFGDALLNVMMNRNRQLMANASSPADVLNAVQNNSALQAEWTNLASPVKYTDPAKYGAEYIQSVLAELNESLKSVVDSATRNDSGQPHGSDQERGGTGNSEKSIPDILKNVPGINYIDHSILYGEGSRPN